MKEILAGNNFGKVVELFKLEALQTYSGDRDYCVWVLSDESYAKLVMISDAEWKDEYHWWRIANGTNISNEPTMGMHINGKRIVAWYNESKLDDEIQEEIYDSIEDEAAPKTREEIRQELLRSEWHYLSLTDYCRTEWGATTERNVCAITVGLAKMNGISLSELWCKYQRSAK